MTTIQDFKLKISSEQIAERIQEIARQIDLDYRGKEITLVMVMKGALCLTADLIRALTIPCCLEYVQASSYGQKIVSGDLELRGIENLDLKDKHVIIVDDIFDTGKTMTEIKKQLLLQEPSSLKTLVLLLKNRLRSNSTVPDYVLFPVDDEFVIGYGLDYQELYRGLPGVYTL